MAPGQSPGRFLADAVCALDLEAAYSSYGEMDGRGMSAYAPAAMARVLLYGQAAEFTVRAGSRPGPATMWRFAASLPTNIPTPSTLEEFCKRHLQALAGLCLHRPCSCAPSLAW
ncbi:MAG: transposase [Acidobacteriaceae bacterium]